MPLFKGSTPYAVDIYYLEHTFPAAILTEGTLLKHAQLAIAVQCERPSRRYYGVIRAWMSRMRMLHSIEMAWKTGVGVVVLGPVEILAQADRTLQGGLARTQRALDQFARVDRQRLEPEYRTILDNRIRLIHAMRQAIGGSGRRAELKALPSGKRAGGRR